MNLSFLETFYWLGALKSVSAVAERMRISQPVVSMRMAALQRSLGLELYRGSGRSFELTHAGRRVLAKCESMLIISKELEEVVRDAASAATSAYVGITEIIALSWLPEFLQNLKLDQPALNVGIRTGLLSELITALQSGEIDLALVVGPINDPTLISDDICEFSVKWVSSPNLLTLKPQMDIRDLARLPIIRSTRGSYRHEKMLEYFRWHGLAGADEFQPSHWIDVGFGMMTCAHLASRAVGVTALPATLVSSFLHDGQLSVMDIRQEFLPWRITAIRSRSASSLLVDPIVACARQAAAQYALTVDPSHFRAMPVD